MAPEEDQTAPLVEKATEDETVPVEKADDAAVPASGKRGAVCQDVELIANCWHAWAKSPIFLEPMPDNKTASAAMFMKSQGMWRDLQSKVPKLTFAPTAVKAALALLRSRKVGDGSWHRELTSTEAVEFTEVNCKRFMDMCHCLAETLRKRRSTAWLQKLLFLPLVVADNAEEVTADRTDAPVTVTSPVTKFDWSSKRAQRYAGGELQYANLDQMSMRDGCVVCRCSADEDLAPVEDVTGADFQNLVKSVTKPVAQKPLLEFEYNETRLLVKPDNSSGSIKIMFGSRQLCQIMVRNKSEKYISAAVALLSKLAEEVKDGKLSTAGYTVKMEKEKRWAACEPTDEDNVVEGAGEKKKRNADDGGEGPIKKKKKKEAEHEKKVTFERGILDRASEKESSAAPPQQKSPKSSGANDTAPTSTQQSDDGSDEENAAGHSESAPEASSEEEDFRSMFF